MTADEFRLCFFFFSMDQTMRRNTGDETWQFRMHPNNKSHNPRPPHKPTLEPPRSQGHKNGAWMTHETLCSGTERETGWDSPLPSSSTGQDRTGARKWVDPACSHGVRPHHWPRAGVILTWSSSLQDVLALASTCRISFRRGESWNRSHRKRGRRKRTFQKKEDNYHLIS